MQAFDQDTALPPGSAPLGQLHTTDIEVQVRDVVSTLNIHIDSGGSVTGNVEVLYRPPGFTQEQSFDSGSPIDVSLNKGAKYDFSILDLGVLILRPTLSAPANWRVVAQ